MNLKDIQALIRDVPDFPKPGIVFKDITPILENSQAFKGLIDHLAQYFRPMNLSKIAGPESRGFIFGSALAYALEVGFVLIRKPGKLPRKTLSQSYALEYGSDRLEIHEDSVGKDDRILLIDDLLATGGTARACVQMLESTGARVIQTAFVIELSFLNGREQLKPTPVYSIFQF